MARLRKPFSESDVFGKSGFPDFREEILVKVSTKPNQVLKCEELSPTIAYLILVSYSGETGYNKDSIEAEIACG